ERRQAVSIVFAEPRRPATHHRRRRPALGASTNPGKSGTQAAQGYQDHEGRCRRGGKRGRSDQVPLHPDLSRLIRLNMSSGLPKTSVAEKLAERIVAVTPATIPLVTTRKCEDLLIDVVGLCVTARNEDYVTSALSACEDHGICTVIGHARMLSAAGVGPLPLTGGAAPGFVDPLAR